MFTALVTPLDALSNEALFSAHMVQHILLMLLAPACLLLGTPGYWIQYLYKLPVLKQILPIVTHPLVTLIAFMKGILTQSKEHVNCRSMPSVAGLPQLVL